ncbi:MAG: biotin--protein ligase [Nanoarchaeota archaeon]|nr:biotin--protein ligase [Nanoarchaeota archaeon]
MREVSKKITGGKLVRIQYDEKEGIITAFRLLGDFFLYPESALPVLEQSLLEKPILNVSEILEQQLEALDAQFIGVSAKDIQDILEEDLS